MLGAKRPALVKCSYCKEGDNIDEVDDVKQTQKEPNNIKKSQKQKNAEEVDWLCAIDSSKDDGSGGLLQGEPEYPTTRSGRQSRAPDSGDLLRYSRFTWSSS